jgi:hypothetical protein
MQCGEVKFASSLSICTGFITYIYIHIYIYIVHIHTHVARLYGSSDAYDMISIYIYVHLSTYLSH